MLQVVAVSSILRRDTEIKGFKRKKHVCFKDSLPEVFSKNGILKDFAEFTGKQCNEILS